MRNIAAIIFFPLDTFPIFSCLSFPLDIENEDIIELAVEIKKSSSSYEKESSLKPSYISRFLFEYNHDTEENDKLLN